MIDLHCHLLPGIDDGPATPEQALELAALAVANGITHATVTPHVHPGRYENTTASITAVLEAFRAGLAEHNIGLQLGMAGEVRISPEILIMVEQGLVPFLGQWQGKQVMLLELPHSHVPPGSDKLVQWLLDRNIQPMIAHPERNKDVMRDLDKITPFVELGCLFQLTAMSVAGRFGEAAEHRALDLLEMGVVTIIASDAHNVKHRPPDLEPGRAAAARIVGEEESWRLVRERPLQIAQSLFTETAA
ncbi:MAG: CpsB/CapC family capsule biosynthesis tyrosine phosphatase [Halieaceae bacterium]